MPGGGDSIQLVWIKTIRRLDPLLFLPFRPLINHAILHYAPAVIAQFLPKSQVSVVLILTPWYLPYSRGWIVDQVAFTFSRPSAGSYSGSEVALHDQFRTDVVGS